MKYIKFVLGVLFISLVFVFTTCEKEITVGSIQGIVTDASTNEPIQGVNISLSPTGLSAVTGSDGRYEFTNLQPGQYSVQGVKKGYESNTKNITIVAANISSGDMMLTPEVTDFKLNVEYLDFGSNFDQLNFKVINTSKSLPINYTVTESLNWLEVTPSTGSVNAGQEVSVQVKIDRKKIDQSISANLTVEAADKTIILPVNVTVSGSSGPNLQLSETSLDFGTTATSLSFYVMNTGPVGTSLNWTCSNINVDWLTLTPTSGNTDGGSSTPVLVTIDRSKIDGVVSTSVSVSGAGSTSTVTISASASGSGAAILQLSEGSLNFGQDQTSLNFLVKNVGSSGTTLDWTIENLDVDWLTLSPMTGHTNAGSGTKVAAAVDRTKFTGTVNTTVKVNSPSNSATLSVTAVNNQPLLEVSTETVNFGGVSTTQNFTIKNAGNEGTTLNWKISAPSVNWLTVSPSSGNLNAGSTKTVTLTIDRNKFTGDVSTTLRITAGSQNASVLVTATTATAIMVVTPTSIDFGNIDNTKTLTIKNEGEEGSVLNYSIAAPSVEWISVTPTSGNINANSSKVITVTLDRSKFTGNVSTTLQITGEGQTKTVDVMASTAQATLSVSQTTIDFGTTGTTRTVTVKNEGEESSLLNWRISDLTVDWLTVNPTTGSLNANATRVVTFTLDRTKITDNVSTTLEITGAGQTETITVSASVPVATLSVTPTTIDFGKTSTTQTFTIKNEGQEGSVMSWSIASPTVEWLTVSPANGSLNANASRVVTLTLDRTKFSGDVSTTLQISGAGQNATVDVVASTAQATLAVSQNSIDFGTTGTTKTFTVKNEGEEGSMLNWSIANPTVDWLTVAPTSGSLTATSTKVVTLTLDRTKITDNVSTTLTVTAAGQSETITVSASVPVPALAVTPTAVDFGKISTTQTITVKNEGQEGSTLDWSLGGLTVDWLTVSPANGSLTANGTRVVTLTLDRTKINDDVSTTIQIRSGEQSVNVNVGASVAIPNLLVTPLTVDFGKLSSTKTITIKNNGEEGSVMNWTIDQPTVAWLSVSSMTGSLNANTTANVTLTIDRTLFDGEVSTSLHVTAGGQTATIAIAASTAQYELEVTPTELDFGTLSTTKTFTVKNAGETGSNMFWNLGDLGVDWLSASPTSGNLGVNQSATVTLTLDRTKFTGNVSNILEITAGTQSANVSVTAATPVPAISVTPASVDFGTISTTQQITISNTGQAGSVLNYIIETPSVTWLTVTPSSGSVSANLNTTINLIIDRNAFMGIQNTNLYITGAGTTVTLPITVDNRVLAVDGLIAYYTFDDGLVTDWGGNYNGVSSEAVTSTDTPNNQGFSMEFNGTSSYLQIPYPIFQTGTTWSYNVWIKTGRNNCALFATNKGSIYNHYIVINQNSKLSVYPYNSNGWTSTGLLTSYLNNQWHMLTISYDGSHYTVYLDGVLFEANTYGYGWNSDYSNTYLGAEVPLNSYYFEGKMDNIRTYNRALTQAEVTAIYNARQ